jgi:nucleoside 2-deoxyribosyltransferase
MSAKYSCYLAGPIKNLTYDESEDWREYAKMILKPEIECFSPLRNKKFLRKYGKIGPGGAGTDTYDHESPLASSRGIMSRDHFDVQRSDLVFCNLLGAKEISIGTCMEVAWCFAYRKPLVVCVEKSGNLHDHPMIREATNFACDNLDSGIDLVKMILLPGYNHD